MNRRIIQACRLINLRGKHDLHPPLCRSFHQDSPLRDNANEKEAAKFNRPSTHQMKFMNPIVRALWEQRQEDKQRKEPSKDVKTPSDSKIVIDYKFSTDDYLREAYQSPGGTMRFGKVLEDLDALAGNSAFRHVEGNGGDNLMLVTAAVDRIALKDIPELSHDQRLTGQVTYVGSSSMEIRMQFHQIPEVDNDDNPEHWLEGYFTFVAVDRKTNRPVKICPLIPETSEERALFELGSLKTAAKKKARKSGFGNGKPLTEEAFKMESRAEQLMNDAFPLLRMPSLADPNAILMSSTQMQNCMIAQPQVRNLSNKIFGGFLMRRAFELAFSVCYAFGGEWPQMLEVDNITFNAPVNVGDLLQFNSKVIYSLPDGGDLGDEVQKHSSKPLVMIEVECYVMEPEIVKAKLSNRFYFTFVLPTKETCRKVMPGTLEEARRVVQRMAADEEQGLGKGYLRQYELKN